MREARFFLIPHSSIFFSLPPLFDSLRSVTGRKAKALFLHFGSFLLRQEGEACRSIDAASQFVSYVPQTLLK